MAAMHAPMKVKLPVRPFVPAKLELATDAPGYTLAMMANVPTTLTPAKIELPAEPHWGNSALPASETWSDFNNLGPFITRARSFEFPWLGLGNGAVPGPTAPGNEHGDNVKTNGTKLLVTEGSPLPAPLVPWGNHAVAGGEDVGGTRPEELESPDARSTSALLPPGLELPVGALSHGSVLHETGDCRPCAWYWKPGSCQNGRNCLHCHACPEGELKARKKKKQTMMRLGWSSPKTMPEAARPREGGVEDAAASAFGFFPESEQAPAPATEPESTTCSGSEPESLNGSGSVSSEKKSGKERANRTTQGPKHWAHRR